MTSYDLFLTFLAFSGGLVLGIVYLALLRASVRAFLHDQRAGTGAVLTVARLVLVGAGFWGAVQFGALGLIAAIAGFTVARVLGTRKMSARSWT